MNKLSDDVKNMSSYKYKKSERAFSGVRSKSKNQQNPHSSAYFCLSTWVAKYDIFLSSKLACMSYALFGKIKKSSARKISNSEIFKYQYFLRV